MTLHMLSVSMAEDCSPLPKRAKRQCHFDSNWIVIILKLNPIIFERGMVFLVRGVAIKYLWVYFYLKQYEHILVKCSYSIDRASEVHTIYKKFS